MVEIDISPHFQSALKYKVKALVMPKISGYTVEKVNLKFNWSHLENLQLAGPYYLQNRKVDIFLGSEFHAQIVEGEVIKGTSSEPIATKSQIG